MRRPPLLNSLLSLLVVQSCSSFSTPSVPRWSCSSLASHHPFDAVRAEIPEDDVNRWLVQKGFEFDSYQRRFDFGGIWKRDSTQSVGSVEYLQAHGLSAEAAQSESSRPYTVQFEREQVVADDIVFRMIVDGGRRNTTYSLGEWTETVPLNFNSALFVDGEELQRKTYWKGVKHVTDTRTKGGSTDTTVRYLEGSNLVVERIVEKSDGAKLACREFFVPSLQDESSGILQSSLKRVPGCVANVDVRTTLLGSASLVHLDGEADAMVSRGIMAVLSEALKYMTANEVLELEPNTVADDLGLRAALSPGRNDGVASMTKTVQSQINDLLNGEESPVPDEMVEPKSEQKTVAMLLSGGVDSSVALNLLKRQGYKISAFYLKIWLEDELAHLGHCPWEDDYRVCEQVCAQAGVPLESISLQEQYKEKVIAYTVNEAERGRTPNPDIMCNSMVKFGCFYDAIDGRGFDYVASGHYAQLVTDDDTGLKKLVRAPDPVKDQSYFLCALTQEQLKNVVFPIGHLQKAEVRELAEEFDLPNKKRPDSQGLCFLGKVKFDEFLSAYLGERPGDILDAATGENLGRHKGLWFHTVGQRKGIGKVLDPHASHRGPWYVVSKDPSRDVVFLSNEYDEEAFTAARTNIYVEDIHWIDGKPPATLISEDDSFVSGRLQMKIRHGPRIVDGSITLVDSTGGNIVLDNKDGGLAPGQFVVFYEVDEPVCLGGGIISERHWAQFQVEEEEAITTTAGK